MTSGDDISYFAETDYRGVRRRFGIRRRDRRYHIYCLGKTGMGKSSLMETLAASDLEAGAGLALLDPHGDLAERVLKRIPKRRRKDLIYFDPSSDRHALAFNVLNDPTRHPYLIASGILGAFKKVWGDSWGPRMEHIFRYTLLGLLAVPDTTLLDVPRMLVDKGFRERVLWYVKDEPVQAFFKGEFDGYTARFRGEAIAPILNKVGHYLANPRLRAVLGQKDNQLAMRSIMDEGKVLLVNLSKGRLGEDGSAVLGALLLSQIEVAALSRADVPEDRRPPFYLYVDELGHFATESFAGMLSESRKYGLRLTLANQLLAQLDEKLRSAIFGNVGTLIVFQVGAEDAEYLEKEFAPTFSREDLVGLPRHHIYLKLMVEGVTSRPFSARTVVTETNNG